MPLAAMEDRLRSVAQDAPSVPEKVVVTKPVDREKTCPLLLRVFVSDNGRHHRLEEFSRGNFPGNELQIYTWMDATLKELTSLVKEVRQDARRKGTTFQFATVYLDRMMGRFKMKEVGQTIGGTKGPDDAVTLAQQKFQIGDFMDIAITIPREMPRRMQMQY